jgi:large subunit ribosomal protein MRP49
MIEPSSPLTILAEGMRLRKQYRELLLIIPFPQLLDLRCGPGAAVLPTEVTRIHMDFSTKLGGGHMGAKYVSIDSRTILQHCLIPFLSQEILARTAPSSEISQSRGPDDSQHPPEEQQVSRHVNIHAPGRSQLSS